MNRRTALKWLTRLLGMLAVVVVAVPGGAFVWNTVRRKKGDGPLGGRLAKLSDLIPGQPFEAIITANWRDAWIVHPQQTVGRVWLVRRTDASVTPDQSIVEAFSFVCTHMGGAVDWIAKDQRFFCSVHNGAYEVSGDPTSAEKLKASNPVPRPLDKLPCKIVEVKTADASEWWVEVVYEQFEQGLTTKVVKG